MNHYEELGLQISTFAVRDTICCYRKEVDMHLLPRQHRKESFPKHPCADRAFALFTQHCDNSSWCRVGSVYSGHGRDGPGYVPTNAWQHLSGADSIVWPKTQGVKFTAGRRKPNPNPNLIDGYTREREVGRWID
ncbi:hypothetical protein PGT21_015342 [Puccinia graminis f. sp. tritici]|uniref:Uncharacterized protein n=1 Tax=Puccinia graminis f. sp. tritici TaxID=56615 RepID=A0A5B0RCC4_PUCGR|nr:hypothetical protein PGT21_004057 [Puccinia graminis f. sp. tritici]KAA1119107.1 hypothetical protein PGT21_015342 [Puccinia graminis f. sp. tritici]KAA1123340.1 hypothetical protein PGTUg99_009722 [Puccinia graminis f. sp. tritici]